MLMAFTFFFSTVLVWHRIWYLWEKSIEFDKLLNGLHSIFVEHLELHKENKDDTSH